MRKFAQEEGLVAKSAPCYLRFLQPMSTTTISGGSFFIASTSLQPRSCPQVLRRSASSMARKRNL